MKKNTLFAIATSFCLFVGTQAFAQIDNLVNCSPEYIRTGARNAATDGTDIIVYNPGGAALMTPGFHVSVGNQSFMRKPMHQYTFDYGMGATTYKYSQDGNDMYVPNVYLSYNKDNWAVMGGAYIAGGGATANFPTGSINTDMMTIMTVMGVNEAYDAAYTNGKDAYLKASSAYMAGIMGGSYKVNDMFSFGMYARYIMATNTTKAGLTIMDMMGNYPNMPFALDATSKAAGMGIVMGMNFKPMEKMNMAIRYESATKLNFKNKTKQDDFGIMADGDKSRRDLPAVLGMGLAYDVTEKLTASADFNYYFQTGANWGTTNVMGVDEKTSKLAGNSATYSMCLAYKITPKFLASVGGVYSAYYFKDMSAYYMNVGAYETVPANNFSACMGVAYRVSDKVKLNAGYLKSFYKEQNVKAMSMAPADVDVKVKNSLSAFALGVDFTF